MKLTHNQLALLLSIHDACFGDECTGACDHGWYEPIEGIDLRSAKVLDTYELVNLANGRQPRWIAGHVTAKGRAFVRASRMWEEKPQEVLSRYTGGIDWGRERKIVIRSGQLMVAWTPGHTAWKSIGTQGYYYGSLIGIGDPEHVYGLDLALRGPNGERRDGTLVQHLADEALREKIAKHLHCEAADLPQFKNGRTYVRRDMK